MRMKTIGLLGGMSWESTISYYRSLNLGINERLGGLLGTAFTMEKDFYKGHLSKKYNLEVITPHKQDRIIVHETIYRELCRGKILDESKLEYLRIINNLAGSGAEAVILGCTEIGLLVKQRDTRIELFDTTAIHVNRAIDYALNC